MTNKHSAARTVAEQPCDISPCFMSFRKIANHVTRDDIPNVGLAKKTFASLKERGVLDLVNKKESALVLDSYRTNW